MAAVGKMLSEELLLLVLLYTMPTIATIIPF